LVNKRIELGKLTYYKPEDKILIYTESFCSVKKIILFIKIKLKFTIEETILINVDMLPLRYSFFDKTKKRILPS